MLLLLVAGGDPLLLLFVHLAFKNLRDLLGQAFDQEVNIFFELLPYSGWKADVLGAGTIFQVVNIAPIVRGPAGSQPGGRGVFLW